MTDTRPEKKLRKVDGSDLLGEESTAHKLSLANPRFKGRTYGYGTAGFRDLGETLDSVCVRIGFLATVRSRACVKDKVCPVIGVVVTASHNPEKDNGLKIIDPDGGMMAEKWEKIATDLANTEETKVCGFLAELAKSEDIDWSLTPKIFIGSDTRKTSPALKKLLEQGIKALGGEVVDYGLVTTPQLHWLVGSHNTGREATLDGYYASISNAFLTLTKGYKLDPITIDCGNGVGKLSATKFSEKLKDKLEIHLVNTKDKGLNEDCGAEHVQKTRKLPTEVDAKEDRGKRFASLDGDADRLVLFSLDSKGDFELFDGDKIASLVASLFIRLFKEAELSSLKLGVVQTAYANGASTHYLSNELKVPVACTPTGVKFLHHEAIHNDIGIYFEANGHGTATFSEKAIKAITEASKSSKATVKEAGEKLLALTTLINQFVGDAISDLLLVEVALAFAKWKLEDWAKIYQDYPSTTIKAKVKDRSVVKTADAERKCIAPKGVQAAIDKHVASISSKARRSFVRPSGTEDVVRIYAEADSQKEADELASSVKKVVLELAGGIQD